MRIQFEIRTKSGVIAVEAPQLPAAVGSATDAEIRLKHPSVAPVHALVHRCDGGIGVTAVLPTTLLTHGAEGFRSLKLVDGLQFKIGAVPVTVRIDSSDAAADTLELEDSEGPVGHDSSDEPTVGPPEGASRGNPVKDAVQKEPGDTRASPWRAKMHIGSEQAESFGGPHGLADGCGFTDARGVQIARLSPSRYVETFLTRAGGFQSWMTLLDAETVTAYFLLRYCSNWADRGLVPKHRLQLTPETQAPPCPKQPDVSSKGFFAALRDAREEFLKGYQRGLGEARSDEGSSDSAHPLIPDCPECGSAKVVLWPVGTLDQPARLDQLAATLPLEVHWLSKFREEMRLLWHVYALCACDKCGALFTNSTHGIDGDRVNAPVWNSSVADFEGVHESKIGPSISGVFFLQWPMASSSTAKQSPEAQLQPWKRYLEVREYEVVIDTVSRYYFCDFAPPSRLEQAITARRQRLIRKQDGFMDLRDPHCDVPLHSLLDVAHSLVTAWARAVEERNAG
jgi:hypothetical protein